jgi:hypothetical protein
LIQPSNPSPHTVQRRSPSTHSPPKYCSQPQPLTSLESSISLHCSLHTPSRSILTRYKFEK